MKFNFKIQQYQTDAVEAVVKVFNGQGYHDKIKYIRDLGKIKPNGTQMTLNLNNDEAGYYDPSDDTGYKNELIELSDEQLLKNIQTIQKQNNIKTSASLVKDLGKCSLDIEMETGTGKTYVYIKTMFELNKRYGWSKFIVVVPSIAIREGVKKSFDITADHFMEYYHKKIRPFVYNSSRLNELDNFSSGSGINVMIINTQAFAASLKEGGRSKESRIIYSKRDEFASRRPIDVIKANRPIIILDEPQKMGGDVTQKALKNFNPLFTLNYSATHKKQHNLIYVLDALDAFNKKLVKKIEVKELPELDDEFAKDVSEFDTLEEYKADIKKNLEEKKADAAKRAKEDAAVDAAVANATMEIPDAMLDTQVNQMIDDFARRMQSQGLSMEQYFQFTGQSVDKMMEDMKPQALKRIQTRLVLEKIAEVENIQPTEDEVNEEISKMAEMYKMEADKLKDLIGENEMEQMKKDMAVQKAVTLVADAAVEA